MPRVVFQGVRGVTCGFWFVFDARPYSTVTPLELAIE
jgi:hypothetical protein